MLDTLTDTDARETDTSLMLRKNPAYNVHVLCHTFLRKLAETKGVHYAREASGHQSDRYI